MKIIRLHTNVYYNSSSPVSFQPVLSTSFWNCLYHYHFLHPGRAHIMSYALCPSMPHAVYAFSIIRAVLISSFRLPLRFTNALRHIVLVVNLNDTFMS